MKSRNWFSISPRVSLILGAIGAVVFWGVFSGWFSSGEARTQIAAPVSAAQENAE